MKIDIDAVGGKMKSMYAKARAARKEGKRVIAKSFFDAGKRMQRQIKAAKLATPPAKKEAAE